MILIDTSLPSGRQNWFVGKQKRNLIVTAVLCVAPAKALSTVDLLGLVV
ncbi:hypothetical protein [Caballeronia sp. GACF5]|jgi:hypothetical protein|nr:hypothetical protein [Caballeronia sp. GACF5]